MRKHNWKKKSGRSSAKYHIKLPFAIREELDLFDENIYYNEWHNWRDGFRALPEKNRIKFLKSRKKQIPNGFINK